ncbi:hypothetical protein LTR36_001061 [Oleoguttula mirabilis]|uniref:Nuclear pore complex protein Nup160 n=1 Tax=Oleoguttula mirabilis TaxID=1507867 RepID=A0AAV9JPZ7_9PEZI|nr:hypothetical protein LTR36_001061 [Oleoguttula mirabilis]
MAQPPILYREVRIAPTPASPSSVLHINTTSDSHPRIPPLLRAGSKRAFADISGLDEESYARKHLATEASVFFRGPTRSPRSFLWRVLDDRKVLEIQAVDLVKANVHAQDKDKDSDGWLTYHVSFAQPILQQGVAFAEPEEDTTEDALECYVLTESRELFTVTLRRHLLTRADVPAEFDAKTCVKKYTSSFLSVRHPYRFVAVSSLELLVSLGDGGLVRLERRVGESGGQWRETFFSEGGWSGTLTLKRMFAQHQTVRYGSLELDTTAIADMAKSPDGKYVWTVSLDHWLRAWSTKTGKIVAKMDLLNQREEHQRRQQPYVMSAEQGRLLQIVRLPSSPDSRAVVRMDEDDKYYLVVHSPKDHQFKFYDVSYTSGAVDGEGIRVQDLQSGSRLVPPVDELLNTNIWHLEQFYIQPGHQWMGTQLWIRARSGAICRNFMLTFDVLNEHGEAMDIQDIWQTAWSIVDAGPLTSEELKHCAGYPGDLDVTADGSVTPSEKWLAFLFYPGRFSTASTETALHIYRKGRGLPATSSKGIKGPEQPLEERLTTAITSKVLLRRLPNEQPDYDRYQQDIQTQWQTFYSLLSHLQTRRHDSVGLAFDAEEGLPWSICADFIAPVRACSGLELRSFNTHLLDDDDASASVDRALQHRIYPEYLSSDTQLPQYESVFLSRLLLAARELRRSLSPTVQEKLHAAAAADALLPKNNNKDDAPSGRAQAMFERCGLDAEVTDEDFDALAAGVESLGGLGSLADLSIMGLLDWVDVEGNTTRMAGRADTGLLIARYGASVTVAVARETLQHAQAILLDVLALVVFMAGGLEAEELDAEFHADDVYDSVVQRLKRVELFLWLAGHVREQVTEIPAANASQPATEIQGVVTLLEDVFIGDWEAMASSAGLEDPPLPTLLTAWAQAWLQNTKPHDAIWEGVMAHILTFLLRRKELGLATEFLPFLPTGKAAAWSLYATARFHLAVGDYAQASVAFRSAAPGCAALAGDVAAHADTAHLLSEHERGFFGKGLAVYFQHVTALFEKMRLYGYVADFAGLALQHTARAPDFARSIAALDRKKGLQDSPTLDRIDDATQEIRWLRLKEERGEILQGLFNALVLTGRVEAAFAALVQMDDVPVKLAGLRRLVEGCVGRGAAATGDVEVLLRLPLEGEMAREADRVLEGVARQQGGNSGTVGMPAWQILYALRTQRGDFRAAAAGLYEQLERLRDSAAQHTGGVLGDPEDETLTQCYVLLINTLACCGEQGAWLLAEPTMAGGVQHRLEGSKSSKRRLVTLADLRREYTAELDRRSDMVHGRFALVGGGGGEEMDVL